MKLYPLTLDYASSGGAITITVTPAGWGFTPGPSAERFRALPVAERLTLRGGFEAQAALASKH